MTDDRRAKQQSKLFSPLGLIPSGGEWVGQSIYQYRRIRDLMIVRRKPEVLEKKGSIWVPRSAEFEWVPQFPDGLTLGPDRCEWCISKWNAPAYVESDFRERFGNVLAYPRNGTWFLLLPLKYLPDEEWTQMIVRVLGEQGEQTAQQAFDRVEEYQAKKKQAEDNQIMDLTRDNLVNHVPGKLGGPYSAPRTKFDR